MRVPPGFHVSMFASEPAIRQCILVKFDDRGRLWTIQYLQYPNPAGLKRVKVDRYSRTVYDRVPEPPPKGPKGADRVTICEDADGDGRADKFKDFLSDLNLATGLEFGYGGVFVLQAPYLLFYPDRNRDDVPDGPPEVLLSGFGMEDAQAMANHLTWGPDGWLYGLNGSTTTCRIRGVEFQQGVWRYHPRSRRFELFCEGGGNVFGLTFDADGQLFYSSNGARPAWHAVQGAYYHKQFDKHGELHNPYAYGYFQFVPHENYRGGHVTCGGTFYYGDSFPPELRGKYIANNLLAHEVHWHSFFASGSTFRSRREGELLVTNDTWSAPVDLGVGPDGAVYVADFFDKRTAHPDPDADWDRTNGRIYRIQAAAVGHVSNVPVSHQKHVGNVLHAELHRLSSDQLVDRLADSNNWYVERARRILSERRDPSVVPRLRTQAADSPDDRLAIQSLWALYVSDGFDDAVATRLLGHRSTAVRYWTIRFLGDAGNLPAEMLPRLVELARREPNPVVRSQLAASSKRLPASQALPLVWALAQRGQDMADPFIPLLLWWTVEAKVDGDRARVLATFTDAEAWRLPLTAEVILPRLMKRSAAEGTPESLAACARLMAAAPGDSDRRRMLESLDDGLGGKQPKAVPPEFRAMLGGLGDPATARDARLLRLHLTCGSAEAHERIIELSCDTRLPTAERVSLLEVLGQLGRPTCVPRLLTLLALEEQHDVEIAALRTLARFDDPRIPAKIFAEYGRYSEKLKGICRQVFLSRRLWAIALLKKVDQGAISAKSISAEELRELENFHDEAIDALVQKHWGRITRGTPEEKLADIRRFNNDLRAAAGNAAAGKAVFKEHCAKCHRLFGEGENIGPDLTTANRKDQDYLLTSSVDPSSFIRVEYLSVQVVTKDGRILAGLVTEQTPFAVTLANTKAEVTKIARTDIDEIQPSQISQMPEGLLSQLTPQQLRDLFAYLRSNGSK